MSFDFTVSIPEGCLPCCNSPCGKLHAEAGGVFNGFRPFLNQLIDTCYHGTKAESYLYLTAQHKIDRKAQWGEIITESHWTHDVTYSGSGDGNKVYECYTYEGYHPDGSTAEWWDNEDGWRKIEYKEVNGVSLGYYVRRGREGDGVYDGSGDVVMPSPNVDGDYEHTYCQVNAPTVSEDSRSYSKTDNFPDGSWSQYGASTQLSNKLTFGAAEAVVEAMLDSVDMDGTYVGQGSDGLYYKLTLNDDYPNTHAGTASDPIRLQSVRIQHYPSGNPSGNLIRMDQYSYYYGDAHFISNRNDSCENETASTRSVLGTLVVEMGKTKAQNGRVFTETYDRGPGYCAFEPARPDCAEVSLGGAASALIEADRRGERIEVTVLCDGGGDNWCIEKWGPPPEP